MRYTLYIGGAESLLMPTIPPKRLRSQSHTEHTMLQFIREEEGATAIEYGLIASLIAVFIIGAVATVGTTLSATFGSISSHLSN